MNIFEFLNKPYKSWIPKKLDKKVEKIESIEIDIVSHCNLNCKGCSHFSPIATPWFIKKEDFEQDIIRTAMLLPDNKIKRLYILGGEPLLHPDISYILKVARQAYRHVPIFIITNGFLLDRMDEEFWNTCKEKNIAIEITRYPVKFDYSRIATIIKERNYVHIEYKGRTKLFKKRQYVLPIDSEGKQDGTDSFRHCFMAGSCINLSNGHLYTCSYAAFINRFNKYFNKNIPVTSEDSVDIYSTENTEETIKKLTNPIPLCRYCAVRQRRYGMEWEVSCKEYSEWGLVPNETR